jgi:hypothetical protein
MKQKCRVINGIELMAVEQELNYWLVKNSQCKLVSFAVYLYNRYEHIDLLSIAIVYTGQESSNYNPLRYSNAKI